MTKEYLLETFDYNKDEGTLVWKVSRSNIVKVGEEVRHVGNHGYKLVRLFGKLCLVHKLIWFLETGTWPRYIDHKDGNRLNNCIENLREATSSQNNANRVKCAHGHTSKYKGVYWHKQRKKWHVQLSLNGKNISNGLYHSEEEAALAYNKKALEIHGEFAKLNDLEATR